MSGEANNINSNRPAIPPPAISGQANVSNVNPSPTERAQDVEKGPIPANIRKALNGFPVAKGDRGPNENILLAEGFNILSSDDGNEIAKG